MSEKQELINKTGMTTRHGRRSSYIRWIPYLLLLPFFLDYVVFNFFPIINGFYISLQNYSMFGQSQFVGLENYIKLLHDDLFYVALGNTIQIVIMFLGVLIFVSLIIAYLLHLGYVRGKMVYQTIFFLPYITFPVAVGLIFHALYDWQYGFLNRFLMDIRLLQHPVDWLDTPQYSKFIVTLTILWDSFGYGIVMIMAGLQGIQKDIYEAATIDGANGFDMFWRITLPLLRPVLTFLVITLTIWGLQLFDETYLLYGPSGGTNFSALTLVSYLYTTAFTNGDFGYGATIGYGISIIVIIVSLLTLKLMQVRRV